MSGSYTETVNLNVVARGTFGNLLGEVNKFKTELKNLKLPNDTTKKLEGSFDKLNAEAEKFKNILSRGITTKSDFSKMISSAKGVESAMSAIRTQVDSISNKQLRLAVQNLPEIKQLEAELNKVLSLQKQFQNYGTSKGTGAMAASEVGKIDQLISKMQQAKNIRSSFNAVGKAFESGNIDKVSAAINRLNAQVDQYKAKMSGVAGAANSGNAILAWTKSLQQGLNSTIAEANRLKSSINQLQTNKFNQMKGSIDGISSGLNTATNNMRHFVNAQTQAASRTNQLNEQVGLLRTQANYFFGLQNVGRLISRGIREAAESVRDLDKAMTETAVVTDFSVSDMWKMLPEYTALANKLGATTQGAYETMTLYFQQGLNKQQTFEIGEETMKMARIAGLDYAQTTNMMTAALRGFNMELNKTSAQRVNDVYSKLAAITASDTRELGLAMERTASIAHSANMDFGNVTAFLAQMIETTREAPENLGTAMKTIIARFQELKENPYSISEVEGEEVSFNRIDKALKTIGVDLMDNRDKFRDLDDVFMEISSKWDTLSQTQQRYIATMAAGSRQQSRFLAMVQNYERLKELTDAAANSEGASAVQFAKTLDSYEAKVNKLKNAWQQFTMELANNQAIKTGIGILEKIITFGNKIIETFGKMGSVFGDTGKGVAEMAAAFGLAALGFRGLKAGANAGLGMLSRMTVKNATGDSGIFPAGKAASKGMSDLTREERAAVAQKRKALYEAMNKGASTGSKLAPFNVKDLHDNLKDLSAEQQKALYSSSPGLRKALEKSWGNAYKGMNLTKETNAAIKDQIKNTTNQIKNGEKTVTKAISQTMNPYRLAKEVGGPAGREIMGALDKEIAKQASSKEGYKAIKELKKAYGKEAGKLISQGKLKAEDAKGWVQNRMRADAGTKMQQAQMSTMPVAINKATAAMGKFSGATMKGGQAMMGLGMAMSAAGFPAFGAAVMTVGTGLMGLGMAAEGAAAAIDKLGVALNFVKANPVILAWTGLAAAFAAVGVAIALHHKKMVKDTRIAGKKVVDNYTQTTKKIKKELEDLESYQENWATWAAGVDNNGNNINLGTEEYKAYLNAVKNITTAHPELIKGYNALGNAIIDNNSALREATKLAKEEEEQATKTYLATTKGQKIVDKQKTYKRWKKSQTTPGVDSTTIAWGPNISNYKQQKSDLETQAQSAVEAIKKIKGGEEYLKEFGITFDQLGNITQEGIENLRERGGDLNNAITNDFINPTKKQQKKLDEINDSIAAFGETTSGLESAAKDYYDWAWEYATDQGYNEIDSSLIQPFQKTIQRWAEAGIDAKEMKSNIKDLGTMYQDLGGHAQQFNEIQRKVTEAQEQFGIDLNADAYQEKVGELVKPLDEWIESLEGKTGEADKVLKQFLETQRDRMLNLSEGVMTLVDAFSMMDGATNASRAVYENWEKQNEGGDLYTAADNFHKMYEEVNDDIDNLGRGSQQWWSAMSAMLGEDYVFEHSKEQIEKQAKQINSFFEEGRQGAQNFKDFLRSDEVQNIKLDENLFKPKAGEEPLTVADLFKKTDKGLELGKYLDDMSSEQWDSLAKSLGMSTEAYRAAYDKAKQFYNLYSGSEKQMRAAIATGESTVAGTKTTTTNGTDYRNLYMRQSEYRQAGLEAGKTPEEINKWQKQLEKTGVTFLKLANEKDKNGKDLYTQKDVGKFIKDWGIAQDKQGRTTSDAFIKYFDKLGYNQEEIRDWYNKAGNLISDKNKVDFNEQYKTSHEANADPATKAATSIDGNVSSILGVVQSIAVAMGVLTKGDKTAINEGVKKADKDVEALTEGTSDISFSEAKKQVKANINELENLKTELEAGQQNYEKGSGQWNAYQRKIDQVNDSLDRANAAYDEVTKAAYNESQARNAIAHATTEEAGAKTARRYNDTAIGEDKKLDTDKLNALIDSVHTSLKDESKQDQNNVIGQYLQNSTRVLAERGASDKEISASIQQAAKTMADNGMNSKEIAAAINQGYGTTLTGKDVTTTDGKVQVNLDDQNLQEQLANLQADVTANITAITIGGVTIGNNATGQNNPNSAFRRTGTMARGSRKGYTISGRPTLMGEEGEEVVWEPKRNEAYIVGSNGPQFGNISKNAVVWNAQQTKKIKKNSKTTGKLGTGARGISRVGTMAGGNGGGLKLPGTLTADTIANITEADPKAIEPVPVKAKLDVEGAEKGGLKGKISSLLGKGDDGPTIKASVEATNVKLNEDVKALKLIGEVTKLQNQSNLQKVDAIANVTKVVKSGEVTGEPVQVQAKAVVSGRASGAPKPTTIQTKTDNGAQTSINNIKRSTPVLIKTKADDTAQKAINNITGKTVYIHIKPSFDGDWTKNATVHVNHDANGQNNYIPHRTAPHLGSAAKGKGGTLGPRGKGGLTLTGERGFEIAWLPSENRSMILGAHGPQMLNLPKDAVVWTHEQSKKILKSGAIHAGSMDGGDMEDDGGTGGGGSGGGKSKKKKNTGKNKSGKGKWVNIKTPGKVSVWWDNQVRKVEAVQRAIDKLNKKVEKGLKKIGQTLKSFGNTKYVQDYFKKLRQSIKLNKQSLKKANKELKRLDKGGQKATISYTQKQKNTKTDKKRKKTKKAKVNLSKYIKYDEATGTYVVDQDAIDKVAKKNKSKAKAIKDAANQRINDKLSKRNTAEDNIAKAREALEKLGEDLYNTFFAWKNELTKIWNLTQQIELEEGKISRIKEYQDTLNKQLATGMAAATSAFNAKSLDMFSRRIDEMTKKVNKQMDVVKAQQSALNRAVSVKDERSTKKAITDKLKQRKKLDKKTENKKDKLESKQEKLEKKQNKKKKKKKALKKTNEEINALRQQIAQEKDKKKKEKLQKNLSKKLVKRAKLKSDISDINSQIKGLKDDVKNAQKEYNDAVSKAQDYMTDAEKLGYETYLSHLKDQTKAAALAQKYMTVTKNGDGTYEIEFNADKLEEDKEAARINEDTYNLIKEYIDGIIDANTGLNEAYLNANQYINELYDELATLQEQWADYANELWDISDAEAKKEAENFKKLSDAITDAMKKLLDEVRRKLEERRQREDNAKTEREISQKQQRLAALRADTAGGHQVEIAQLEKEIADAQQDYQRTLEDQLLEKLEQQADLAAKQRERQIELQEAIAEGVNNAALVDMWMADPEAFKDDIYEAYKTANKYNESPKALQQKIDRDFEVMYNGLVNNQAEQAITEAAITSLSSSIKELEEAIKKLADGTIINDTVKELHDVMGLTWEEIHKQAGKTLDDFIKDGIKSAKILRSAGFKAEELKKKGYGLDALLAGGYNASELKSAGYTAKDLYSHFTGKQLREAGYSVKNLQDAGYKLKGLVEAGYSAKELKKAGYNADKLNKYFNAKQLKEAGFDAKELKKAGFKYHDLKEAGFSDKELGKAGYEKYIDKIASIAKNGKLTSKEFEEIRELADKKGIGARTWLKELASTKGLSWKDVLEQAKSHGFNKERLAISFKSNSFQKAFDAIYGDGAYKKYRNKAEKNKKKPYAYASGGLADHTGPAWLDGTPSKPELVLNATDTKNFLALRDVLGGAIKAINSSDTTYGNSTYEININVDHISSDYDVDRMAERIKKDIIKSAGYRNVTQVRNFK